MQRKIFSHAGPGVATGLGIAAAGLILTVLSFKARGSWSVGRYWPMLVVGFGAMRIAARRGRPAGWILLAVGGAVQLSNLGLFVLPSRQAVRYWPLVVVLAGLWELAVSRSTGEKVEGFAVVLLGAWLQLSYIGAVHIASYRAWPLVLLAAGIVTIWRGC